jgi:uncharacterized protein (TIGR02466 family)
MSINNEEKEKKAMEEFQQRVEAQMKNPDNQFSVKEKPVEIIGHLNFGPFCTYIKVDDDLCKGLLERGTKLTKGSANKRLAGLLGDQRIYSAEDKEWFVKSFQPYMDAYVEGHCKFVGQPYDEAQFSKSFTLMDLWINYMKEREMNPSHTHGGQLTWVIYLKTPDLEEERKAFQGTGLGPGVIGMHYGENTQPKWAEHTYQYIPEAGFMWIFPAQLRHEVFPYQTPGERISVSGNCFMNPPNQKSKIMTAGNQPYVGLGKNLKPEGY